MNIKINGKINKLKFVKSGTYEGYDYSASIVLVMSKKSIVEDVDLGQIEKEIDYTVKIKVKDLKSSYIKYMGLYKKGDSLEFNVDSVSVKNNFVVFNCEDLK